MKCQHPQKRMQTGPRYARCLGDVASMASAAGPSGFYVVPLGSRRAGLRRIGIGFRPDRAAEPGGSLSCGWAGGTFLGRFSLGEVLAKPMPGHSRS